MDELEQWRRAGELLGLLQSRTRPGERIELWYSPTDRAFVFHFIGGVRIWRFVPAAVLRDLRWDLCRRKLLREFNEILRGSSIGVKPKSDQHTDR